MSAVRDVLQMEEGGVLKFLAAGTHLGGTNLDFQMEQYTYRRNSYGVYIINLKRTWEKLLLAACAIVALENPADVSVTSSRNTSHWAVLKFVAATGAIPIIAHFSPGTFTNQIQAAFWEPRFLLVTDPRADHQPLTDVSYINLPTIALCNTDSPLCYADIAILQEENGRQRMKWLDGIIDSMDMSLSELWKIWREREAWCAVLHGIAKSWAWLNEQQQQQGSLLSGPDVVVVADLGSSVHV